MGKLYLGSTEITPTFPQTELSIPVWKRPVGWPVLSDINRASFEGVYFTVDCTKRKTDGKDWFVAIVVSASGGYKVERGSVSNGVFTRIGDAVSKTSGSTFLELTPTDLGDYVVYKVTSTTGNHITDFRFVDYPNYLGNKTLLACWTPVVECYGRLPYSIRFYCYRLGFLQSVSVIDMAALTNTSGMFNSCFDLQSVDTTGWDTKSVTNMSSMFSNCQKLHFVDTSTWNTAKVTTMASMFSTCKSLIKVDVSGWNTASVNNMSYLFYLCYCLQRVDVSNWNTSKVTTFANMFNGCTYLEYIDVSGWDTSSSTNFSGVFNNCACLRSIDVSGWDTSKATTIANVFSNCPLLETVDVSGWETGLVTNMSQVFYCCYALKYVDVTGWDTSNVTTFQYIFGNCWALEGIDISNFSFASATTITYMFYCCSSNTHPIVYNGTSVSTYTFYSCSLTLSFTFPSTTMVTLGTTNAFNGYNSSMKIYVPSNLVNTYKAATNWRTYASYIYPIPE